MADCCERPSKARYRALWIILVVLTLMLAAKALWGLENAPPSENRPSRSPSMGTPEMKANTGDVFHFSPQRGPGSRHLENRQQGRPLETFPRVPRSSFQQTNLLETS